jgi:hypothetical protein
LDGRLNVTEIYDKLSTEDASFWTDLLTEYFDSEKPFVLIRGCPSVEFNKKIEGEEKARVAAQKEKLGPDGVAACGEAVKKAIAENEVLYLLLSSKLVQVGVYLFEVSVCSDLEFLTCINYAIR